MCVRLPSWDVSPDGRRMLKSVKSPRKTREAIRVTHRQCSAYDVTEGGVVLWVSSNLVTMLFRPG